MIKSEKKTLQYYNDHAQDWGEHHNELGIDSRRRDEIEEFHNILPSGKIIEIGSGTGSDAKAFSELKYDYLGTDASSGLLKLAQKRNPGLKFKIARVQDLANIFTKDEFDGFWAAAILLHLPKLEIEDSLESIHKIVRDGGVGFISVKQGEGESIDDTGRLFSYYSQSEFSDILLRNDFEIIRKRIKETEGSTVWLEFFVKVRK